MDFKKISKELFEKYRLQIVSISVAIPTILVFFIHINYYEDIIPIYFIFLGCLFIWGISIKSKYELIIKLISICLFLHLTVFPCLYLWVIKKDINSIVIDPEISAMEKERSILSLYTKYKPTELVKRTELCKKIIEEKSSYLDSSISALGNNILFFNELMIHKTDSVFFGSINSGTQIIHKIAVCDSAGKLISLFPFKEEEEEDMKFYSFFNYQISNQTEINNEFKNEQISIEKDNNYWTYSKILSYSFSTFFTGNLKPKSRIANIIYGLHFISVFLVLLSVIVRLFATQLSEKK
ncbi:hypothetical protein [uncultured Aquimarina sp.]|uniref:hypothetical protein n=1 Tax=uncultured Aquimarina sp. TaxID=575652 RepID=UPI0026250C58|nr:hypothetical protein [uncultured Aquimarina sp.]